MHWLLPLVLVGCIGGSTADSAAVHQELMKNVDEIRQMQIELLVMGEFTACGDEATAKGSASGHARTWDGEKCWSEIGWKPDGTIHGGYWVVVDDSGFTVHGIGPQIGKDARIHVVATQQKSAHVKP